jgi:Ca-activated chloride channel family protein
MKPESSTTECSSITKCVGVRVAGLLAGVALMLAMTLTNAFGAGLLKPLNGPNAHVHMKSHEVNVTIDNGFAKTEVDQVFVNEGDQDLEATYTFPLPKQASLSELSLWIGDKEVIGEVVEKQQAREVYNKQKAQGKETALAEKDDYKTFNVSVGRVQARAETRVRFVYYQPLEIDLNVGRYLYPLADGNVDDQRIQFWSVDDAIRESFTFNLVLKSAFPVKEVRLPDYQDRAAIEKQAMKGEGQAAGDVYRVKLENKDSANLSRDIVFYYRLDDSVPARLELIPYRPGPEETGTFMVVVTPAASLKRITEGTDWTFVLDVSGSMSGRKLATLADGVVRVLGKMFPQDRFRIVTFNTHAQDFSAGFVPATPENVQSTIERIKQIQAGGSTALYEGLDMAYQLLDADRTTGIILVTDGVCNEGPTRHEDFLKLIKRYDIRLFTIVIGNSANQPLMDRLAKESGGFAMNISEGDDIAGRLVQAKAKVLHECLHDVQLSFQGEKVKDLTPARPGSLFMGQQLVMFGRYTGHGEVDVELKAKISGQEQTWRSKANLPLVDTDNPELERLWALSSIEEQMEVIREKGETDSLRKKVVDLGKGYSLVTDYTSMIVLREDEMEAEQIQRNNVQRVERERQAQQIRDSAPVKSYRVDQSSENGGMFGGHGAPRIGSGPVGPLFVAFAWWLNRRKRADRQ